MTYLSPSSIQKNNNDVTTAFFTNKQNVDMLLAIVTDYEKS